MKKVALADVLWEAANLYLYSDDFRGRGKSEYSCHAVVAAIGDIRAVGAAWWFLQSLGCNPSVCGTETWDCWEGRQGVRYMWLLLAMHVAEDERIMIEVEE